MPAAANVARLEAGGAVDRYELIRTLGVGAFGRTVLARDRASGRQVAIKVLETGRVDTFKGFELFDREAAVLRSVRHHGVPEIFESLRGEWEGRPAALLVMEYVEGPSLKEIIDGGRHLDPAEATHILLELLGVLDYLHGRVPPILHRDLKPANIILRPDGFPVLVDFGAVRNAIHPAGHDGSTIVGTYGYMPFEQHMGRAAPSSDLYSLGATFVHLLTGRPPQEFLTADGSMELPPSLPGGERLRQVLARLLLHAPSERYQSAREARQALLESAGHAVAAAGAPGPPARSADRRALALLDLPPAPRRIEGELAAHFRTTAPTMVRLMHESGDIDPRTGPGLAGAALILLMSTITLGIVPAILLGQARVRRRRLRRFFELGTPALAEITAIEPASSDFVKLALVKYEWTADGEPHRDSDEIFARISDRWRVGDRIPILYLAERNYDSVIIAGA
jgi:hypothetical protein